MASAIDGPVDFFSAGASFWTARSATSAPRSQVENGGVNGSIAKTAIVRAHQRIRAHEAGVPVRSVGTAAVASTSGVPTGDAEFLKNYRPDILDRGADRNVFV